MAADDTVWVERSLADLQQHYGKAAEKLSWLLHANGSEVDVAAVAEQCNRLKLALQARMAERQISNSDGLVEDTFQQAYQVPHSELSGRVSGGPSNSGLPAQGGDGVAVLRD